MLAALLPAPVAVEETFAEGTGMLLPEEEALVTGAGPRRARDVADGRTCARRALSRLGAQPGPVLRTDSGAPLWPPGVVGSITHCAGYRAAAVAWRREVPVIALDAEPGLPVPRRVIDGITLPEERAWLERLDAEQPEVAWGRLLFSAKEAVYKAWYPLTGRWLGFADAVISVDAAAGTFTARLPGGGRVAGFDGCWRAGGGLLVTAVTRAVLRPDRASERRLREARRPTPARFR
ncbi:4'-phosphopantetheinyl transferase [Nonomuraea sp. NPDC047897]|uniref:4'-phosphopantetheinyl transferase family protein n=1 Tax=Nonomuraea sp. NPDC047897 TaxID=3364346 RepID=UPI00371AB169